MHEAIGMWGHHQKSIYMKSRQLQHLQASERYGFDSLSNALDNASSGRTGSQRYTPHKIRPSSESLFPAHVGMPIGGILCHYHPHIPSRPHNWSAAGRNTMRPQHPQQYLLLSVHFHFSGYRKSPFHRQVFGICFDKVYIGYPLEQTEANREGRTFRDFEHELLEAQLNTPYLLCEYIYHKAIILWLSP